MPRVPWFLPILLSTAAVAAAHDPVRDPVCGMMIEPENAAGKAEYLGKTYYFCQAREREQFLADPAKFVSTGRIQASFPAGLLVVTVDPAEPAAGDEVRIRVVLAPANPAGAGEKTPLALHDAVARFYDVDRDRPTAATAVKLQPLGSHAYGALRLASRPGETRFVVEASTESDEPVRLVGSFVSSANAAPPPADEPFTMARQHEVMRRFGRRWQELEAELGKETPDAAAIGRLVEGIEEERKRLPLFQLHVNGDAKAEFVRYGDELKVPLAELGAMAARGEFGRAREQVLKLDTESCVKCHLKFRWDVVKDLSRFPRLEGAR